MNYALNALTERDMAASEYAGFQKLLHHTAGIALSEGKQALVAGRLAPRLRQLGLQSYRDYHVLVQNNLAEAQTAVDLLTTNETRFFREPQHFGWLRDTILPGLPAAAPLRVWSAAASTGQEAYSIAMTLSRYAPERDWRVFGSDISTRVIAQARAATYPIAEAEELAPEDRRDFCLRGIGTQTGRFAIVPPLRERVQFDCINLNARLPAIGQFQVIFLRNVLIYFRDAVRRDIVARVIDRLSPGGWLIIGHSESLGELGRELTMLAPSVFRK